MLLRRGSLSPRLTAASAGPAKPPSPLPPTSSRGELLRSHSCFLSGPECNTSQMGQLTPPGLLTLSPLFDQCFKLDNVTRNRPGRPSRAGCSPGPSVCVGYGAGRRLRVAARPQALFGPHFGVQRAQRKRRCRRLLRRGGRTLALDAGTTPLGVPWSAPPQLGPL